MFFAGPRTGIISAVQLPSDTFATQKVCKLLLQIARLLSKVKVSILFAQLFAPIKSVHEESCENHRFIHVVMMHPVAVLVFLRVRL